MLAAFYHGHFYKLLEFRSSKVWSGTLIWSEHQCRSVVQPVRAQLAMRIPAKRYYLYPVQNPAPLPELPDFLADRRVCFDWLMQIYVSLLPSILSANNSGLAGKKL